MKYIIYFNTGSMIMYSLGLVWHTLLTWIHGLSRCQNAIHLIYPVSNEPSQKFPTVTSTDCSPLLWLAGCGTTLAPVLVVLFWSGSRTFIFQSKVVLWNNIKKWTEESPIYWHFFSDSEKYDEKMHRLIAIMTQRADTWFKWHFVTWL